MPTKLPSAADISAGLPGSGGTARVEPARASDALPIDQTGSIIANVGALIGQEAQKLDRLRAEDALNQIRQARLDLTMGDNGAYQVKGGNVLDPTYAKGFSDQLRGRVESVMSGLSASQKAMLQSHADREVIGFQGDILRHSMTEAEAYKGLVRKGSISTAQNIGIEQWADPVAFNKALVDVDTVVNGIAAEKGLKGATDDEKNAIMAMRADAASPLFVGAIQKAIDAKTPAGLARAEALYQQGLLAIEPNARLRVREALDQAKDSYAVQNTVEQYVANTVLPMNSDKAGIKLSINMAESKNRSVDPTTGGVLLGRVIESGANKGDQAVGREQLMPKTAEGEAKAAGIPWDKTLFYAVGPDGDKYRSAIQDAYLSRLTKKYDKPEDIFAAYNAGEGNVDEAHKKYDQYVKLVGLAKSDKTLQPVPPAGYVPGQSGPISWMDFLPKPSETKPYVEGIMRSFAARPDFVKPSGAEVESAMRERFPNRPDLAASASKIIEHRASLVEAQRKDEIEKTKESLYKFMAQGQTIDQISPSMLNSLPPRERQEVESTFTEYLAKRKRDSDTGFLSQINNDPNYVARLSNSVWNGKARVLLSEYDWQRFDKQRSSLMGGNVEQSAVLDTGTVKRVLDARLRMLDIDPTPKEHDTKGQQIVNSARAVVDQSILARQAQIGRKMTEPETIQHVNDLFMQRDVVKGAFGFLPNREVYSMASNYSDIPTKDVESITLEFQSRGVRNPTKTQILTVYKQKKAGLL